MDSYDAEINVIRKKLGDATTGHRQASVSAAVGMLAADVQAAVVVDEDDPHEKLEELLQSFFELVRGMSRVELARLRDEPIPEDIMREMAEARRGRN